MNEIASNGLKGKKAKQWLNAALWLAVAAALLYAYRIYIQYVPTTEMLQIIDDAWGLSLLMPLAGMFSWLFKLAPLLLPLYAVLMGAYSLNRQWCEGPKTMSSCIRNMLNGGKTIAIAVGLLAFASWSLFLLYGGLASDYQQGARATGAARLQMLVIVIVCLLLYLYTLPLFFSDVHDGLFRPYHVILNFFREHFLPLWWLGLVIAMAMGPVFAIGSICLIFLYYLIRIIFSRQFWIALIGGTLTIALVAALIGMASDD